MVSEETANEVTAVVPKATITLGVWVWEVIVSVLRQKDEFGHISAAADAIEWQLRHPVEPGGVLLTAAEAAALGRVVAFADRMFVEEFSDCDAWRNWKNAGMQDGDIETVAVAVARAGEDAG